MNYLKAKIVVISYNKVQSELVSLLNKKGILSELTEVNGSIAEKERLREFEQVVLPFPTNKKTLSFIKDDGEFTSIFDKKQRIIGGMIDSEIIRLLEKEGISYSDYFKSEAYVLKNAFITSQGALRLLFENTEAYLAGSKALVTGYGRIGKSLTYMLKSLGVRAFVAARSEAALCEARANGFDVFSFSQLKGTLFYYDYIFNTVPAAVFGSNDVKHMKDEAIYFELASQPYGADKADFELYGKRHIQASALPGRFYPLAVAENIAEFIIKNRG